MSVAYSRFARLFRRNPASGALVDFVEHHPGNPSGSNITAVGGADRVQGTWSIPTLSGLTFVSEFNITSLPADGDVIGLFNGVDTTATDPDPRRSVYLTRSGSTYLVRVSFGNGKGDLVCNFDVSAHVATGAHRMAVRFPAAGANAGVAFDTDQVNWIAGARLMWSGSGEISPINNNAFTLTSTPGNLTNIWFRRGWYTIDLQGVVSTAGWAFVGQNGFLVTDAQEFVNDGAALSSTPPNAPTNARETATGLTTASIACDAPVGGPAVASYEIELGPVGGTLAVVANPDTTYDITALTAVTEYQHRWRAIGTGGLQSAWSAIDYFWTDILITGGGSLASNFPEITSLGGGASGVVSIPENTTVNAVVFTATATGSDPKTWSLAGPDAAFFAINPSTGVVTLAQAVDFESTGDVGANNVYNITVGVTNGEPPDDSQTVAVTVTDSADTPAFFTTNSGNPLVVSAVEGFVSVTQVAASGSGSIVYSLAAGADNALFTIHPTTGVISFVTAPIFGALVRNITAIATNAFGSDSLAVAVTTTDLPQIASITTSGGLGGVVGSSESVSVTVLDEFGDPAELALVSFESEAGVTATSALTDAQGIATLTFTYATQGTYIGNFVAERGAYDVFNGADVSVFVQPDIPLNSVQSILADMLNPKYEEEVVPYIFNFDDLLPADETVMDIKSITCVSSPASFDPQASQMLVGDPVIRGRYVGHFIASGKKGGKYVIRITAKCTRTTATSEITLRIYQTTARR